MLLLTDCYSICRRRRFQTLDSVTSLLSAVLRQNLLVDSEDTTRRASDLVGAQIPLRPSSNNIIAKTPQIFDLAVAVRLADISFTMIQEAGPSRPLSMPSSTPAVPRAYPNLQTATQV